MSIKGDSRGPLGRAISIDLNTVGDTFIEVPVGKYIPRNVTLTNVSTTMAGSSATVGMYTAASAGGTAIVTPAVITSLTGSTVYNDRTIAAATTVFTPTWDSTKQKYGVYFRVGVVHGSAATLDGYLFGDAIK